MQIGINEFIDEQRKGLAELLRNLSKTRVTAARDTARQSAARIKELNGRVRALARSGVRLTSVSHGAAQDLIELHADIVNAALTEAASQLERMAYTESVRDLAHMQAEVLQAARQRIADDVARAVAILKTAAGDARKAVEPETPPAAKAKAKAKAKARARPRRPAARAKTATRPRAKAPAKRPRRTSRPTRRS